MTRPLLERVSAPTILSQIGAGGMGKVYWANDIIRHLGFVTYRVVSDDASVPAS